MVVLRVPVVRVVMRALRVVRVTRGLMAVVAMGVSAVMPVWPVMAPMVRPVMLPASTVVLAAPVGTRARWAPVGWVAQSVLGAVVVFGATTARPEPSRNGRVMVVVVGPGMTRRRMGLRWRVLLVAMVVMVVRAVQ